MKVSAILFVVMVFLSSFDLAKTLTGKYIYAGDIENGKKEGGPTDYTLKRIYDNAGFTAYVLQNGYKTERYETGKYTLSNDTCLETQTWCSQPSKLLNVAIHYQYSFNKDTLVLKGVLPNGTSVEEYWKRVK